MLIFGELFVTAACFQAGALLFISYRRPFRDTLRTVAYAHAPLVCAILPLVGGVMVVVWLSVLLVVGLRVVHETTKARVVTALSFWPTLALLVLAGGCYLLVSHMMRALNASI